MIYQKAVLSDFDKIVKMKDEVKQRIIEENLPIWLNGYPLNEMIKEEEIKLKESEYWLSVAIDDIDNIKMYTDIDILNENI